jgi:hypothetical protein
LSGDEAEMQLGLDTSNCLVNQCKHPCP